MKQDIRSEFEANDELIKAHDARVNLLRASRQTYYTKPEEFRVRKPNMFLVDAALALLAGFILSLPFLLWITK